MALVDFPPKCYLCSMPQKFYLAPLRGVTDGIFRTAFERYFGKFDYLLTPFITTVKGKEVAARHLKDIAGTENDRNRVIPQVIGNDPDDLLLLAKEILRLGYTTVNWNLGCPHPLVTKKKRGSGLLPHPDLVVSILDRLVSVLPGTVSVKVRLGLIDDTDLERLLPLLNDYPLGEVIIHPRTGRQAYRGPVDLDRFAAAAALCRHPVVYNGDIDSLDFFLALQDRFPRVTRWMLGRGVVRRPMLLATVRSGIVQENDPAILRRFHDELFQENGRVLSGPTHLLGKMKEWWSYFASNFTSGGTVLKKIQRCSTIGQYRLRVDEAFGEFC